MFVRGSRKSHEMQWTWLFSPCSSTTSRLPATRVQAVDVLGDYPSHAPGCLHVCEGKVSGVGLGISEPAVAVQAASPVAPPNDRVSHEV